MALLQSGDLALAFTFASYRHEWVHYQVHFLWKGETLVNHANLKTGTDHWDDRPAGALLACDDERDGFIATLRKVVREDCPAHWEPIDPDLAIAIHPGGVYPFHISHSRPPAQRPPWDQREQDRQREREIHGPMPSELYTVIAQVDAYNFRGANAYQGQGLALHLVVTRSELEAFAQDLKQEYSTFCTAYGVPTK